jgi:hypothetical protein
MNFKSTHSTPAWSASFSTSAGVFGLSDFADAVFAIVVLSFLSCLGIPRHCLINLFLRTNIRLQPEKKIFFEISEILRETSGNGQICG